MMHNIQLNKCTTVLLPRIGDAWVVDNAEDWVEGVSPRCSAHWTAGHPVGLQQAETPLYHIRREPMKRRLSETSYFHSLAKSVWVLMFNLPMCCEKSANLAPTRAVVYICLKRNPSMITEPNQISKFILFRSLGVAKFWAKFFAV